MTAIDLIGFGIAVVLYATVRWVRYGESVRAARARAITQRGAR